MRRAASGGWLAGLTLALIAASSCTSGGAPGGDTVTVQSAVGTNVVVTVRDGVGAALAGRTVYAVKNNGSIAGTGTTNASGQATINLAASSYRFLVEEDASDFYSGAVGHCVTPGCTTAMITVPRVDVTVVDTSGSPQVNQTVLWENTSGTGGFVSTGANGHVVMAVPTGSYRFVATQNDFDFTSGAVGHCTVPSCTAATITTTIPVTVTVRDTANVPKPNLLVSWATTLGETGGWVNTNASGVAVLSVPQASMRFAVDVGSQSFFSGAPGHCTVPGCTSASITVSAPVLVTVVDTSGTPQSGKSVMWQQSSGTTGGNTNTNASGQAVIIPPLGVAVRFKVIVDGTDFYSSATYDCSQPGCTTATILVSAPTVVTVVDGAGAPVSGRAVTPTSTEGITSGNKTTNTSGQATFRLPFAHWQFKAKCSSNNETFFSGNAGHCFIPGGCLTAKIKMPCGQCAGKPNGFACDDQTACSGTSTCQSQFCTGSNPMSCSASDQCHDAGACGAETGTCSNPPKANGSACNDNNACTGTSSCQAGVCTGGSPTTCTAQDQCHVAGTCNPATGVCSNPPKANGSACDDNDACTGTSSCQAGVCTGGNPTTCTAQDQCHGVGACNPSTGACTNPTLTDGTGCNDGSNCTSADVCTGGNCAGTPVSSCGFTVPPLDRTIATDFFAATSFLYSGSSPVQTGVSSGTIDFLRAAVVRGLVTDRAGNPVPGVTVSIHGHPEFGQTTTRTDGMFDLAVNGGGVLNVDYEMQGFLSVQRRVEAPVRDYIWASDVALTAMDPEMTVVNLPTNNGVTIAQGSVVTDERGYRQATLMIPPDTTATMELYDGTSVPLSQMRVRLSEYTVGPSGPKAMPALLPSTSGYTYAVDYSADEAIAAGAKSVHFNHPVVGYLENFIGFPSGGIVPVGYYDRDLGAWVAIHNGVVVKIVEVFEGLAEIDTDGDEVADDAATLAAVGISDPERAQLATLYLPGQTLWRFPVPHFSTLDPNWPVLSAAAGSAPPQQPKPKTKDKRKKDPCKKRGSIIQCENQVLGEAVPITGTPFGLEYSSDRVPGFRTASQISIPATGASPPPSVKRIEVEIQVAGRRITNVVPSLPNQSVTFDWDGNDAYGRPVQGTQGARVALRYVYNGSYGAPGDDERSFGLPSDLIIVPNPGQLEMNYEQVSNINVGNWNTSALAGMGGWDLSIHRAFSPSAREMLLGAGETLDGVDGGEAITRIAGTGQFINSPDGVLAKDAPFYPYSGDLERGPDGSFYFIERINGSTRFRIRRIRPDGILTTVAGDGSRSTSQSTDGFHSLAEGFPAVEALMPGESINVFPSLAVGKDGSVFFTDGDPHVILRIGIDGILTRVAGRFIADPQALPGGGDGEVATDVPLRYLTLMAVAVDGTILFTEQGASQFLRRVTPDGLISTLAGNSDMNHVFTADGLPAKGNPFWANSVVIGNDDSIYFYGYVRDLQFGTAAVGIRRIGTDGLLTTVAGNGIDLSQSACFAPLDGPALSFGGYMHDGKISLAPDGALIVTDICGRWVQFQQPGPAMGVVRRLENDGTLRTIFGGGPTPTAAMNSDPDYPFLDGEGQNGLIGDVTRARQWPIMVGTTITLPLLASAVASSDAIYFIGINGGNRFPATNFIYRFSSGFPGVALGITRIPSADGGEIYEFDAQGRHLRTLDALTGGVKYQFGYGSTGLINSVTNTDGLVTTIARDSSGTATAITAPNGQTTTLAMGPGGYLTQITNPAANAVGFTYGPTGLLATHTDLRGGNHVFTFDGDGLLTRDENPAGGSWDLARTENGDSVTVTMTTAEGRQETHTVTETSTQTSRVVTDASGLSSSTSLSSTGDRTTVERDGTVTTTTDAPDPRFGTVAPYASNAIVRTPLGTVSQLAMQKSVTTDNGLLTSVLSTITLNGGTSTINYDTALRQTTITTAANRQVLLLQDQHARVVGVQRGGLAPVSMIYDSRGRPSSLSVGTGNDARITTWDYDALDRVVQLTDPSGESITFDHNAINEITTVSLPDQSEILFTYNPAADLISLQPGGQPAHQFGRTSLGMESSYTPPLVGSTPASAYLTYDLDGRLTQAQRLDGSSISYTRDSAGRLSSIVGPQVQRTLTFGSDGHIASITSSTGVNLTIAHDGKLAIGETWSGTVSGSIARSFDANFRVASTSVNGAGTAACAYDPDGLITQAGSLTFARDPQGGSLLGTSQGAVTHEFTYNAFAERVSITATALGQAIYSESMTRDRLGRIVTRDQTILGDDHSFGYQYDSRRRLAHVQRDGASIDYTYDANGNRLTRTADGNTATSTYDARDRELTRGPLQFSYNGNGELSSRHNIATGEETTYAYDDFGRLRRVNLPSGSVIDYVLDGAGRRVRKLKDGVPIYGLLFDGGYRPIAELDATNQVVSRFVYGARPSIPEYFVRAGTEYRIITDSLGSPRLVIKTADGSIAQRLDYDEFGNVTLDTNPGFQPFGFAGGLLDRDTSLLHFGWREYDPAGGRWTTPDPTRFSGGDANLFVYVGNDPINFLDPTGTLQVSGELEENFDKAAEAIRTILDRVSKDELDIMAIFGHADRATVEKVLRRRSKWCVDQFVYFAPPGKGRCGQEGQGLIEIELEVLRDFQHDRLTQKQFDVTLLHEVVHLVNELVGYKESDKVDMGDLFEQHAYGKKISCERD